MKNVLLALCIFTLMIGLNGCEKNEVEEDDYSNITHFKYVDGSTINGQLCYLPNPFCPTEDTVLCLKNVYIGFFGFSKEYCEYVRNLLSQFGGKFTECLYHGIDESHHWEYLAESEQIFFPHINQKLVSIVDSEKGMIADSIILNTLTVYPTKTRDGDGDFFNHFYMADFVTFFGNDHMKPKFITDTITPLDEHIIYFDAQQGPHRGNPDITNDNPNIFN